MTLLCVAEGRGGGDDDDDNHDDDYHDDHNHDDDDDDDRWQLSISRSCIYGRQASLE